MTDPYGIVRDERFPRCPLGPNGCLAAHLPNIGVVLYQDVLPP